MKKEKRQSKKTRRTEEENLGIGALSYQDAVNLGLDRLDDSENDIKKAFSGETLRAIQLA